MPLNRYVLAATCALTLGCSHSKPRPPEPRTPTAAAEEFLAAVLAGNWDRAHQVFDLDGHVLGDLGLLMMADAATWQKARTTDGGTGTNPLGPITTEAGRSEFERRALANAQELLRGRDCSVGPTVRHIDSRRVGQLGGSEDTSLQSAANRWLSRVASLDVVSLNCAKPNLFVPAYGAPDLQFEDTIRALLVVTEVQGHPRVIAVALEAASGGYAAVLEALERNPAEESLAAQRAAANQRALETRDALVTLLRKPTTARRERKRPSGWRGAVGDYFGSGNLELAVGADASEGPSLRIGNRTLANLAVHRGERVQTVVNLGDTNGDGRDDVAVALIGETGSVLVIPGADSSQAYRIESPAGSAHFFALKIAAGDFDGNGYADLAVLRADDDVVFVYEGGPEGLARSPGLRIEGPQNVDFGKTLANLGDLDSDGRDELALDAPRFENHTGRLFVFFGSAQLLELQPAIVLTGSEMGARLGEGVSACDLDGDGKSEVWVGSPGVNDRRGRLDAYEGAGARTLQLASQRGVTGPDASRYAGFGQELACLDGFLHGGTAALLASLSSTRGNGVTGWVYRTRLTPVSIPNPGDKLNSSITLVGYAPSHRQPPQALFRNRHGTIYRSAHSTPSEGPVTLSPVEAGTQ